MGEAKRRKASNGASKNNDASEVTIILRGSKEARDDCAHRIVKVLGPKGDNDYPGELLDMGDGTSRFRIILRGGSEEMRMAGAKIIEDEVRELERKRQAEVILEGDKDG